MRWPLPDSPRQSRPMASASTRRRCERAQSGLGLMLVMTKPVEDSTLLKLDRAIRLTLNPPARPAEQRLAELGFLAACLKPLPPRPGFGFAVLQRKEYDGLRPATAPSSAVLVRRYGSWHAACYAAYGLQPDGRWTGPGRPWPSSRGLAAPRSYNREEVHAALRQCRSDLNRRPTTNVYDRWRREKLDDARKRGTTLRLPSVPVIYRYYPAARGGWNSALHKAGLKP
jgi:hypothetical protein